MSGLWFPGCLVFTCSMPMSSKRVVDSAISKAKPKKKRRGESRQLVVGCYLAMFYTCSSNPPQNLHLQIRSVGVLVRSSLNRAHYIVSLREESEPVVERLLLLVFEIKPVRADIRRLRRHQSQCPGSILSGEGCFPGLACDHVHGGWQLADEGLYSPE